MHARGGRQDGVSLIEMMVAVLILGIAVAGITAGLINALNLTRQNHNRVVAANLASSEIERILTMDFGVADATPDCDGETLTELIVSGGCTWDPPPVDGRPFTMTRDVYWSANDAALGPCATDDPDPADENILVVDVSVTWPRPGNIPPVRSVTSVAPPVDLFQTSGGIIAVYVADEEAEPLDGVQVNLMGPAETIPTNYTATTNLAGCAVFTNLGIGTYHAVIHRDSPHAGLPGYIDIDQRVTTTWPPGASLPPPADDVTGNQGVTARSRAMVDFFYSPGVVLTVTAEGWAGGVVPDYFDSVGWVYANSRPGSPYEGPSFGEARLVYPGVYQLYTSFCEVADPASLMDEDPPSADPGQVPRWPGASRDTVTADDVGGTMSAVVTFGTFTVAWSWDPPPPLDPFDPPEPAPNVDLWAISGNLGDGCPNDSIFLGTATVGDAGLAFALPWGDWDVVALATDDGSVVAQDSVRLDPTEASGTPPAAFSVVLP